MERECLTILLRGTQLVIICPPRSVNNMRIDKEYKKLLKDGPLKDQLLLFLSPFEENQRRIFVQRAYYRNLFVAALSAAIFVIHAEPSKKTEELCREILTWQKPVYAFENHFNKNIIDIGARSLKPDIFSSRETILCYLTFFLMDNPGLHCLALSLFGLKPTTNIPCQPFSMVLYIACFSVN